MSAAQRQYNRIPVTLRAGMLPPENIPRALAAFDAIAAGTRDVIVHVTKPAELVTVIASISQRTIAS